jgi:UDP:flavonoid glycosyltransferase YjiC (YdhE family)
VTIGEQNDVSSLGQQPANVHVERWLPLPLLLPRCTAAVCHAGSGTTLAALGAGLPLLLLPQGADQFQNAAACARAGVARVITPDAFSAESVAAELANLVCDARYRLAAQRVRGEIAAMLSPAAVVPFLEDLVSQNSSHASDAADAGQPACRTHAVQP